MKWCCPLLRGERGGAQSPGPAACGLYPYCFSFVLRQLPTLLKPRVSCQVDRRRGRKGPALELNLGLAEWSPRSPPGGRSPGHVVPHPCSPPLLKGVNLPWNASLAFRAIKRSHYISINLPGWLVAAIPGGERKSFLLTAAGLEGKAFSLRTIVSVPEGAGLAISICSVLPSHSASVAQARGG